jgi:hypothetical protein
VIETKGIRLAEIATGIRLGDYPVGSLESRVAARALLDEAERMQPQLSEYDQDALTLYRGQAFIDARMTPSYLELERTPIFRRGAELAAELAESEERDRAGQRQRIAGLLARLALGEWQNRVAALMVVAIVRGDLQRYQQAWERQLPELPFPIRIDGTRFLYRVWKGGWEEHEDYSAALTQFCGMSREDFERRMREARAQ